MCGIAGIVQFDRAPNVAIVKAMTDALTHRGPDGEGFFSSDHVVLGHRRLKIIDLSEAARQPIADTHGNAIVTYNGEIYNYRELRRTLSARGHYFASRTDSETIPVAYAEWGDSFLERLQGMFAFALYDTRKRRLLLVRDRIGIKPLYFVRQPTFIAFASEPKAFIAAGLIPPRPNISAIANYIQHGYHQRDQSWYEGVQELEPGHFATIFPDGDFKVQPYWHLPQSATEQGEDPKDKLRALLEEAARTHLQSDVPLGAHLRAGLIQAPSSPCWRDSKQRSCIPLVCTFKRGPITMNVPSLRKSHGNTKQNIITRFLPGAKPKKPCRALLTPWTA